MTSATVPEKRRARNNGKKCQRSQILKCKSTLRHAKKELKLFLTKHPAETRGHLDNQKFVQLQINITRQEQALAFLECKEKSDHEHVEHKEPTEQILK